MDIENKITNKVYIDQTGRFLKTPSQRDNYIMVLCKIDSSEIFARPLESKEAGADTFNNSFTDSES